MKIRKVIAVFLVPLGLFYPFLVYFGTGLFSFRSLSLLLGISFIGGVFLQARQTQNRSLSLIIPTVIAILLCIVSAFLNNPGLVRYVPCLFSISLFFSFGYTLLYPPSMIEVFARMINPDRSPEEIEYCRRVTIVWVLFFIANGTVAFYTACCAPLATWSLYNGLISYCVIAVLFATELCVRYWRFRRYSGLRTDVFFRWLFPPRE